MGQAWNVSQGQTRQHPASYFVVPCLTAPKSRIFSELHRSLTTILGERVAAGIFLPDVEVGPSRGRFAAEWSREE